MKKILVLGSRGMLSLAIRNELEKTNLHSIFTSRSGDFGDLKFNVLNDSIQDLVSQVKPNFIINCIGQIPQRALKVPTSHAVYVALNSKFARELATIAEMHQTPNIQIATDCVFSGKRGQYSEADVPDSQDIYGLSKRDGEIANSFNYLIRCSIVGIERGSSVSLLSWLLAQPKYANLQGYTNHMWNGVTAKSFAKLAIGIIHNDISIPTVQHFVPSDSVTKFQLLKIFAEVFKREDLRVEESLHEINIDRTLSTLNFEMNKKCWSVAGYRSIPCIEDLVIELAEELNEQN